MQVRHLASSGDGWTAEEMEAAAALRIATLSERTIQNYASLWAPWVEWCKAQGVEPLPAVPRRLADYLRERSGRDSLSTLRLRLAAVCHEHLTAGLNPPRGHPYVRAAMAEATKKLGTMQNQALGLLADDLPKLRAAATRPRDKVTLALILVMRDAMLRRAEAAALTWGDLTRAEDGTGRIMVRRAKNDQAGRGRTAYLSGATMLALGAVTPENRRDTDLIFGFSGRTVCRRIQALCQRAGLPTGYSGHSCKVGMAQDLVAAGFDASDISLAAGWANPGMVMRYTRNQRAARGAVARFYEEAA